jgi:hypothetical protein
VLPSLEARSGASRRFNRVSFSGVSTATRITGPSGTGACRCGHVRWWSCTFMPTHLPQIHNRRASILLGSCY